MFDFFDNQSAITRNLESHEIAKSLHSPERKRKQLFAYQRKKAFTAFFFSN